MTKVRLRLEGPDGIRLEATNGVAAVIVQLELEDGEQPPTMPKNEDGTPWGDILIPSEALKAASSMKTGLHHPWVSMKIVGADLVLSGGLGMEQRFRMESSGIGLFPEVERVFPKKGADQVSVRLNAKLLALISDAILEGDLHGVNITFSTKNAKAPILVEGGGTARGALMPILVD